MGIEKVETNPADAGRNDGAGVGKEWHSCSGKKPMALITVPLPHFTNVNPFHLHFTFEKDTINMKI